MHTHSTLPIHPYTHRIHSREKTLVYDTFGFSDGSFLRTLATSLIDFNELSSVAALSQLLEVGAKILGLFCGYNTTTKIGYTITALADM